MDYLDVYENKSIYLIREAYAKFRNIALLWSMGKDSTVLLHLCRKAFLGKLPFPVLHIDTGYKFNKIYEFREAIAAQWGLDLIVHRNEDARRDSVGPHRSSKLDCCRLLKTEALNQAVEKYGFRALLVGIRRDEHGIRAKERYFSPRDVKSKWDYLNQPAELWDLYMPYTAEGGHCRIHPILHMRELDIWRYIQREGLPIIDLYFSKNGQRYRSIGCEPCCSSVPSSAESVAEVIAELESTQTAERDGRAQDKEDEYTMQKLRSLGYM